MRSYLKAIGASCLEETGLCAYYDLMALVFFAVAGDCQVGKATVVVVPKKSSASVSISLKVWENNSLLEGL